MDMKALGKRVEALRDSEYPMLKDSIYLDYAGIPPVSQSLVQNFSRDLTSNLFGNPHSASPSSQLSTRRIEDTRLAGLRLFGAEPSEYDLIFVQNATAAIKLVLDGFRAEPSGFWYGYHADSHTSLVGVREGAVIGQRCFVSDSEVEQWLQSSACIRPEESPHSSTDVESDSTSVTDDSAASSSAGSSGVMPGSYSCSEACDDDHLADDTDTPHSTLELFAYPAQSNMDGRRLPLSWCNRIRTTGQRRYVLLDAASYASSSALDLSKPEFAPDFVALSFYKMFGFPDLGALIVHKRAAAVLSQRKYFGGGTVDMATCISEHWHARKSTSLHDSLEDGTLPFHNIIALGWAIQDFNGKYESFAAVSTYTFYLARALFDRLSSLRHYNGNKLCEIYSQFAGSSMKEQGPILAFNLLDSTGSYYSTEEVEKAANARDIHIRSGGLCNPGGLAKLLNLAPWELRENFSAGWKCGNDLNIVNGKPTGMLRASLGAASIIRDVEAFVSFLQDLFVDLEPAPQLPLIDVKDTAESLAVEQLIVYPIKSCAGWNVPSGLKWEVRKEGLAWDREWCLVHAGTGEVLSQKRCPAMACLCPALEFEGGLLRIQHAGQSLKFPQEITIPLSADPAYYISGNTDSKDDSATKGWNFAVCGDDVRGKVYGSKYLSAWFSEALGLPCHLARFPPSGSKPSQRNVKPDLKRVRYDNDVLTPLLLSNESPLLAVTRASLDKLNEDITRRRPEEDEVPASTFRPNMVLAHVGMATDKPYSEDRWESIELVTNEDSNMLARAGFEVLGPCRRCQMVCIDQVTAKKRDEPFVTLAKTRKREGKVWFGIHMKLADRTGELVHQTSRSFMIRVGDEVVARSNRGTNEQGS